MRPMRRSNTLRAMNTAIPAIAPQVVPPRETPLTQPRNIWIGPAGWSYTDWRGIVYPSYPHGSGKELETVAELFDVVEINTSFYRPLRPGGTASGCASAPATRASASRPSSIAALRMSATPAPQRSAGSRKASLR